MRVGVIGINHKLADLNIREKLAKACNRRFGQNQSLHDQHAFILLSTCNRTEIYFSSDNLALAHTYVLNILRQEVHEDFEQKLYSYFGHDCFCHLCHVTSGLDSAIIGETEIQGQVREAYEKASMAQLPSVLHYLFQKAFKVAKEVRSTLLEGKRMPEVEHAVYQTGMHFFKIENAIKLLFVGASEINQKILRFISTKNMPSITICNRSLHRSEEFAKRYSLEILPWEHLHQWSHYDWIIFGTKSEQFYIQKEKLPDFQKQKLIIDLSFPRNVDPKVARDPRIILLNIDQINRMLKFRKAKLSKKIEEATAIIENASRLHQQLLSLKESKLVTMEAVCG